VILFPAIDLKEGLAVRLEQGDLARATVFNRDPAGQALAFERMGFEYLHIVDLDGAFAGKPMNAGAVDRILDAVAVPVQLGGGIRDAATVAARVAVDGWAETSELTVLEIARRFEDAGVAAIIHTDVARDGMLTGLNLDATIALAEAISIPVIASGGLASLADVQALTAPRAHRLAGAIAGRALYDGRLDAAAALAMMRGARTAPAA
jgi:phosphoribosylformimino-5-aminoimidazole carboxamide ribotide isomerase